MKVEIYSEIAPLKSVILHKPGEEHFFINPNNLNEWIPGKNKLINNPDYLLFDDLINPQKAMEEHDLLSQIIKKITGNTNCIEFADLVLDILNDKALRKSLLTECLAFESKIYGTNISTAKMSNLLSMENHEILSILLTGCNPNNKKEFFFKHPIPNLIFARDIASIIGTTILLTWGRRKVRNRENIIAKHVFLYHEIFTDIKTYDFNEKHPTLSVEGGDIIILNEETVCIGMSERTTDQTINTLLPLFFNEGFKNVYAIDLPKHRSIMHLDTIFNRINNHEAVVFPPLFSDNPNDQNILTIYCISKGEELNNCKTSNQNLLQVLQDCNIQLHPIKCGGSDRLDQVREQWTDGANYFTLSPGIIIGYDCNFNTIIELQNAGYECIDAKKFLMQKKSLNKQSKLMISIPSSELSRGRGGARCLTLPLCREKNNG